MPGIILQTTYHVGITLTLWWGNWYGRFDCQNWKGKCDQTYKLCNKEIWYIKIDRPDMVCMPLKTFKKSLKIPKGYQNTSIEGQTGQWPNEKRKGQTSINKTYT